MHRPWRCYRDVNQKGTPCACDHYSSARREAAIGGVVQAVPRDLVQEVIVVDNGSRDRTAPWHTRPGDGNPRATAWLRFLPAWLAPGQHVRPISWCSWMANGSDDPAEIHHVLQPHFGWPADVVLGSRVAGQGDQSGLTRNNAWEFWSSRLSYACSMVDATTLAPFAPLRAPPFRLWVWSTRLWLPVEMVVKAAKKGYRVRRFRCAVTSVSGVPRCGNCQRQYAGRLSFAADDTPLCLEGLVPWRFLSALLDE